MSNKGKLLVLIIILGVFIVGSLAWYTSIKQNIKPAEVLTSKFTSELNIDEKIIKYDVSQIHPVLDWSHRIMGGIINEKWFNKEEMIKYIDKEMKFQFNSYNLNGFIGKYEGVLYGENAPDEYYMKMNTKDEKFYDATISIAGDWIIQPILPKVNNTHLPNGDLFIKKLLVKNSLDKSEIVIKEIITIDLDGDGVEEFIYNISNITKDDIDNYCKMLENEDSNSIKDLISGKYSIVLIRKIKDGQEKNFIITEEYNALYVNSILFIGDIDNDNKLEIYYNKESIEAVEAEGFSVGTFYLYRFTGDSLEKIEEVFHMPH